MSENKEAFYKKPEECKYSFFQHKECEFFPCHKTDKPEDFNCLFCYCPLYALGKKCKGNYSYTENGIKDCSRCLVPHGRETHGASPFPHIRDFSGCKETSSVASANPHGRRVRVVVDDGGQRGIQADRGRADIRIAVCRLCAHV